MGRSLPSYSVVRAVEPPTLPVGAPSSPKSDRLSEVEDPNAPPCTMNSGLFRLNDIPYDSVFQDILSKHIALVNQNPKVPNFSMRELFESSLDLYEESG